MIIAYILGLIMGFVAISLVVWGIAILTMKDDFEY